MMVEMASFKTAPSHRSRWVNGISILNRAIDQVGFMGFLVYDAYGGKSMSTAVVPILTDW